MQNLKDISDIPKQENDREVNYDRVIGELSTTDKNKNKQDKETLTKTQRLAEKMLQKTIGKKGTTARTNEKNTERLSRLKNNEHQHDINSLINRAIKGDGVSSKYKDLLKSTVSVQNKNQELEFDSEQKKRIFL